MWSKIVLTLLMIPMAEVGAESMLGHTHSTAGIPTQSSVFPPGHRHSLPTGSAVNTPHLEAHRRALASEPDSFASAHVRACRKALSENEPTKLRCLPSITTCTVNSLDGGKTPIATIGVTAGNSCAALAKIKVKACEALISPDRLKSADVKCGAASDEAANSYRP